MPSRRGALSLVFLFKLLLVGGLVAFSAGIGSLCYFEFAPPEMTCLSCHEIEEPYHRWASSAHAEVSCKRCHGGTFLSGLHGLKENLKRTVAHFRDTYHDNMHLSEEQVVTMIAQCKRCHPREYVQWEHSGHGVSYREIFLNPTHNTTEQIAEDCLRCHGMFHEGRVTTVVAPLDTKGPWKLKEGTLEGRPVIPCLACHQIHVPRDANGAAQDAGPANVAQETSPGDRRGTIALYMRREQTSVAAADLPLPVMHDHGKPVIVSPDPRQRLCMQCHAPNAFHQVGSSDDRTPVGVHEGLSCAACHDPHSGSAKASCVQCHPRFSHCGLDVTSMDTTYHSATSKHNIHFVRCTDCHAKGRPEPAKKPGK